MAYLWSSFIKLKYSREINQQQAREHNWAQKSFGTCLIGLEIDWFKVLKTLRKISINHLLEPWTIKRDNWLILKWSISRPMVNQSTRMDTVLLPVIDCTKNWSKKLATFWFDLTTIESGEGTIVVVISGTRDHGVSARSGSRFGEDAASNHFTWLVTARLGTFLRACHRRFLDLGRLFGHRSRFRLTFAFPLPLPFLLGIGTVVGDHQGKNENEWPKFDIHCRLIRLKAARNWKVLSDSWLIDWLEWIFCSSHLL